MKKILIIICLVLQAIFANAQIVNNSYFDDKSYIYVNSYSFILGEYKFEGTCFHGYYKLSCDVSTYQEMEELAAFISKNLYSLNKKYGFVIREVHKVTSKARFEHGVRMPDTSCTCVSIGISTKEYDNWVNEKNKEAQEHINSLKNIL